MVSIFTRKGEEIFIDDEDLDFVNQFTWCIDSTGYPVAHVPGSGKKGRNVCLHKLLVPGFEDVDHVGGNKLDARRRKLEGVSHSKNIQRQRKKSSTGIREVGSRFKAYIPVTEDGVERQQHLGSFKTFDLALLARIVGEIRYWGGPTQQMP